MKRLLASMMIVATVATAAAARTWTLTDGKKTHGDLAGVSHKGILLKKADGKVYAYDHIRLSTADRLYAYGETIKQSTAAIEANPDDANAFLSRALAHQMQRDYDKALDDFNMAVRKDPKLAIAYKNRGDLYAEMDEGENPELRDYSEKFLEKERKRQTALDKKYRDKRELVAQPQNSTTGNVGAYLANLAKADYRKYNEIMYAGSGYGSGYGAGAGGGAGAGTGSGPGLGSGKVDGSTKDGPLMVFAAEAPQGEMIKLVADAPTLDKGMPVQRDPETGKPVRRQPGERYAPKEPIAKVDFYRDSNGNRRYDDGDQYLATDSDGPETGKYRVEVSTAEFPVGPQGYFAVPRGAEGTAGKSAAGAGSIGKPDGKENEPATGRSVAGSGLITPPKEPLASAKPAPGSGGSGAGAGGGDKVVSKGDTIINEGDTIVNRGDRIEDGGVLVDDDPARIDLIDDGVDFVARGDYDQAIDAYSRVIDAFPSEDVYISRANAYRAVGDYDRAIVDYGEALVYRETAENYYNRGLAHANINEFDLAIADYTKAIALDQAMAKAYNNRASVYGRLGKYDEAVLDATAALELSPNDSLAYFNRGMAHLKREQWKQAAADLSEAISRSPDATSYAARGLAHERLGQSDKADADYAKAREYSPAIGR